MGSKKGKGVPCVYCIDRIATTSDHVLCRAFFHGKQGNLPQVPACVACNNDKSRLEHYLATVLPMGCRHDAGAMLNDLVQPRLNRNEKLRVALAEGADYFYVAHNRGPWQPQMTLPLDPQKVDRLYEYIVRGLAFHHWKLRFGPDVFLWAGYLREVGACGFDYLLALQGAKVSKSLAGGDFVYEGAQAPDCPYLTVWKMTFYGGMMVSDHAVPFERGAAAYGLTFPKKLAGHGRVAAMLASPPRA